MKWLVAVTLAGCFGKPGFAHRDAPTVEDDARDARDATDAGACVPTKPSAPGTMLNNDPMNTIATVLDGSQIGFADVLNRYPMVNRLFVGGQNLVATEESSCNYEDRVGIAVYPIYNVGPEPLSPGNPTHTLEVVRSGPAYTLLGSHWTYQMPAACGANAIGAGNTSWSIFPDGKVVRNDTITPSDNGLLTAGTAGCNCSSASGVNGFIVTSYTTFEADLLRAVTRAGDPEATTVPASSTAARGACARGMAGGAVAVWWDRPDNQDPNPPPTRLRRDTNPPGGPGHNIFAFVYDMVPPSPPTMTIPQDMSFGIRTHMLLSQGGRPCMEMLDHVESFAAVSEIAVRPMTGTAMQVLYNVFGVFDDTRVYAEPVVITGTLPAGFTVQLRFPNFTAVSTDRAADRVIWQRQSDGSFYLFFRDGLSPATPITVTPECGS